MKNKDFTLEDLQDGIHCNGKEDNNDNLFGMEMALMGILEGTKAGAKYLLQIFLDEHETPHINLTTSGKPPKLLAKIVIPIEDFLSDNKKTISILDTNKDFRFSDKLKKSIADWFRSDNKYGQNNLKHSRQTWDEQAASKSYGQIKK